MLLCYVTCVAADGVGFVLGPPAADLVFCPFAIASRGNFSRITHRTRLEVDLCIGDKLLLICWTHVH